MIADRDSATGDDHRAALRSLALGYAPAECRDALDALFSLDAALGNVLRSTREPIVGRMRLAWWREALEALDVAPAPAEPVLQALAEHVVGRGGITGGRLARMALAWEWLLETPLEMSALRMHAALRGEVFNLAAASCGHANERLVNRAGRGWVYTDIAANLGDEALRRGASSCASRRFARLDIRAWPRDLRALSALALAAEAEIQGKSGVAAVMRLAWHRLTGR